MLDYFSAKNDKINSIDDGNNGESSQSETATDTFQYQPQESRGAGRSRGYGESRGAGDSQESRETQETQETQEPGEEHSQANPSYDKQRIKDEKINYYKNTSVNGNQTQVADNVNNTYFNFSSNIDFEEVVKRVIGVAPIVAKESFALHDPTQFAAFGEQFKDSIHFAYAISLSVFNYILIRQADNLIKSLMNHLPVIADEEGRERADRNTPYLSLHNVMGVIGGCEFDTPYGLAIGFSENTSGVLNNIWRQFPSLRDPIVIWLIDIYYTHKSGTEFENRQILNAFVKLIMLDFEDAKSRLFFRLISDPGNVWFISAVSLEIYKDSALHEEMDKLLYQWAKSADDYLWVIPCLVYSFTIYEQVYENKLYDVLYPQFKRSSLSTAAAIGPFLIESKRLRCAVVRVLEKRITATEKRLSNTAKTTIDTYLALLRYGYFLVTPKKTALPMVACDNSEQLKQLRPLMGKILSNYNIRTSLFSILSVYLEEISKYKVSTSIRNALNAYFLNAAYANPRFYNDIMRFLHNEKNAIAYEIYAFVESNKGNILQQRRMIK
ncbi:MAG: hypothetical protein FWH52_01965 [Synergistaceae bacterium]|nr:hypothetical protein [Synergistaceae bacterium]